MRRGRVADTTAEAVAGDSLGDAVLTSVLSRITDKRERALLFAHVALDLPLHAVAREFGMDPTAVEATIKESLRKLRSDESLVAQLSGIRRAGRPEHYLMLAGQLNLQEWFCAQCGRFMVQPKVGRPRKTCSDACRLALYLAGGRGWREEANQPSSALHGRGRADSPGDETRRRDTLVLTAHEADALRSLLRRILDRNSCYWWDASRDYKARNAALLLLGFTCPVQLCATDLAAITLEDLSFPDGGLDIRLEWGTGKARTRQYVTVRPDHEAGLCPVRAVDAWQRRLYQTGSRHGPLFPRIARWDTVKSGQPGMTGLAVASLISGAMAEAGLRPRSLSESALLPTFLKDATVRGPDMRFFKQ